MLTYQDARRRFLAYSKIKGLSPRTVEYYDARLRAVEKDLPEGLLPVDTTVTDIRDLISRQIETRPAVTVNHSICALSAMFNWLADEGIIPQNPMSRIKKLKAPRTLIQTFTQEQLDSLLAAPDTKRFSGLRDLALMVLLLDTGLRISEALDIRMDDIDWTGSTLTVMGKGSKQRVVPFGRTARRYLNRYLQRRPDLDHDRLFVSEFGDPYTKRQADHNFKTYGERAGISGVRVSPHTLRHQAAITFIRNGGSAFALQMLLGHTTLSTTRMYVNMARDDLKAAHARCSPADSLVRAPGDRRAGRKRIK